jgi:hypothetical protein
MKLFVVEEMLLCLMMLFLLPAERPHLSKWFKFGLGWSFVALMLSFNFLFSAL